MKAKKIFIALFLILFASCHKRTEHFEHNSKNDSFTYKTTEHFSFNIDTINKSQTKVQPVPIETLIKVFPTKILDFKLEKTNKGTMNYLNTQINIASAEYLSQNNIVIIYIYDYWNFSNLPSYLKTLFELSQRDEILTINKGIGRFSSGTLSNVNSFDYVWYYRFHIKIEAIDFPEFRESVTSIINSLNLNLLENTLKVAQNEKF
ncbi:MAG: hypothetical protein ACK4SO_02580 [Candidatus Kapaibacteriota bacterium]